MCPTFVCSALLLLLPSVSSANGALNLDLAGGGGGGKAVRGDGSEEAAAAAAAAKSLQ